MQREGNSNLQNVQLMLPTDIYSPIDLIHSHSYAHLLTSTKTDLSEWSGRENLGAKQRTRAINC